MGSVRCRVDSVAAGGLDAAKASRSRSDKRERPVHSWREVPPMKQWFPLFV